MPDRLRDMQTAASPDRGGFGTGDRFRAIHEPRETATGLAGPSDVTTTVARVARPTHAIPADDRRPLRTPHAGALRASASSGRAERVSTGVAALLPELPRIHVERDDTR